MAFIIKQGDTLPEMEVQVRDATGTALDLSDATEVRLLMGSPGGFVKIDQPMDFVDRSTGQVKYKFTSNETEEPGSYRMLFEIHYTGGDILTVPTIGYDSITVVDDLFHTPITDDVTTPLTYTTYGGGIWPWVPRVVSDAGVPVANAAITVQKDGSATVLGPVNTLANGKAETVDAKPIFMLESATYTATITVTGRTRVFRFRIDTEGNEVVL